MPLWLRITRSFIIATSIAVLITGCISQQWHKHGGNEYQFNRDFEHCRAYAQGLSPLDYSSNESTTAYHSGTVRTQSGTYDYSGTSTTQNNDGISKGLSNLAAGIKQRDLRTQCMQYKGYRIVK